MALALAACQATPTTPPNAAVLPWRQSSSAVALSADGKRLAAANPLSSSLTLVDVPTLAVQAEVRVGAVPQTVAFTPDGLLALVAARSGTISIVDAASARVTAVVVVPGSPFGIVADSARAYISLSALGQVAVIDLAAHFMIHRIPVAPFPAGLALSGDRLYVTHLYSGRITCIDLLSQAPEQVIEIDAEANLSQAITLSPDGMRAYLPQTLSHAAERELRAETAVSPVINVLDLAAFASAPNARLNLYAVDRAVNLPVAAAVSPDGRWLFEVNAGTDDLLAIDITTGAPVAHLSVGRSPRGLALSPDGTRLFVNNVLDGSLSVVDVEYQKGAQTPMPRLSQAGAVSLSALTPPPVSLAGQRLFNSALPPMSNGWLSCATCHWEGGSDGRTWLGWPSGPRNTPALFGVAATAPFHWSGDLDELQDIEQTIRGVQHGTGLIAGDVNAALGPPNAGRSAELDALADYLSSLAVPRSPFTADLEAEQRGAAAFERWGCAVCHPSPLFADRGLHQVARNGSGDRRLDTPSLLGVWATAPYFHDGSAATLRDTLFQGGVHGLGYAMSNSEIEDLLAYLRALPADDAASR